MSNLYLYSDVAAVGYVMSVEMGMKIILKKPLCLEIKKLKLLSNTGRGLKYGIHSYTMVYLSKCLFIVDRLLYSGGLVI